MTSITSALTWDNPGVSIPNPSLEPQYDVARSESVGQHLLDSIHNGWEHLKDGIHKQIYNDKGFDLPELNFYDSLKGVQKPGDQEIGKHYEITSGGRERDYFLHVPPGYDGSKPMPLVVVLHGLGQDAEKIAHLSKMSEQADKEGFIVAYPNATKWLGINRLRAWDSDNGVTVPGVNSNDVGFIRDMVDTIKQNVKVDNNRVYASGFSNGGMLAYRLASDASDLFSAVAVVSGGSSGNEKKPEKAVSILSIHGTNDHVIPIFGVPSGAGLVELGLPNFQSFRDSFSTWVHNLGATGKPTIERNDHIIKATSVNPETGAEIIGYAIRSGTHEWPGSDRAKTQNPRSAEADFPATQKIWEFFQKHNRNGKPQLTTQAGQMLNA